MIDIGLPDADGRDVCHALRARGIQTPVLFLTARDAVVDRLAGFDAGGDDYLTKPFAIAELVARLHALLRRAGASGAVEVAGIRLDPVTHAVSGDGVELPLTPTEFRLWLGCCLGRAKRCAGASSCGRGGLTARSCARTRSMPTSPVCAGS